MNDKEMMSYNEVYEDVCMHFSFFAFTDEQNEDINKKMADLFYRIINDKCSVEEFCDGLFCLLEHIYDISLNIPESVLKRWYTNVLSGKPLEGEERRTKESPLHAEIYLISSFLVTLVLKNKPKLAKSPVFYQFVRKVILDPRFERGRRGFIGQLLPKVKTSEGIDFTPFLKDEDYAEVTITALLKLKDGRFVKEAERILEIDPKNWFKRQIKTYIERYKEPKTD